MSIVFILLVNVEINCKPQSSKKKKNFMYSVPIIIL